MVKTPNPLILFQERLPHKPYATNNLSRGLRIHRRERALTRRYVQVGRYPHMTPRLVLDVDHRDWVDLREEIPPSLTVVNPQSQHAHVWFELAEPLPPGPTEATLRLLADIEALLETFFRADPGYVGLVGRNPLRVPPGYVLPGPLWRLGPLAEALRLRVEKPAAAVQPGYGRNCTLFDQLRHWAYGQVAAARRSMSEAQWRAVVEQEALRLNRALFQAHPKGPLPPNEVGWTARSVARWTWTHYRGGRIYITPSTGNPDRSRLSRALREAIPPLSAQARQEAQEAGRKRGGATRGQAQSREAEKRLIEALRHLQAAGERVTAASLSRQAGVHRNTAAKWLRQMRK